MVRAIALRRLIKYAYPGVVRALATCCRRAARDRDRARPRQAPEIIQARGERAKAIAAKDIDAAPSGSRQLPAQADALEAAQRWLHQPPGAGHDERQALERAFKAEMREEMVAREQRKPQPQHPIVGEGELGQDVNKTLRWKSQLELIPVARHRPFG